MEQKGERTHGPQCGDGRGLGGGQVEVGESLRGVNGNGKNTIKKSFKKRKKKINSLTALM